MGLRVDEPLPSGGNSNDGNLARRTFRSPEKFASCTGVDVELICEVAVMLQTVSCFRRLNPEALQGVLSTGSQSLRSTLQPAAHEYDASEAAVPLRSCGWAVLVPARRHVWGGGGVVQQTRAAVPTASHSPWTAAPPQPLHKPAWSVSGDCSCWRPQMRVTARARATVTIQMARTGRRQWRHRLRERLKAVARVTDRAIRCYSQFLDNIQGDVMYTRWCGECVQGDPKVTPDSYC